MASSAWARDSVGINGVAVIFYLQAALVVLAMGAAMVLQVASLAVAMSGPPIQGGPPLLLLVGGTLIFLMVLMVALAGPYALAGWGLRRRRPWSWVLGLVMSGLSLGNCPFGIIGGVLGLMVLLDSDVMKELRGSSVDLDEGLNE